MIAGTLREITRRARARVEKVTNEYPFTDALAYRRIGYRQQQLFAQASKANPEYYGTSIVGTLSVDGALDLRDVVDPTPTPEDIQDVQVANPGTSAIPAGRSVKIVSVIDAKSAIPPRATLRDGVIRQWGDELAGVTSLVIYCSRRAPVYLPTDHAVVVELEVPYDALLELDLARRLLLQSPISQTPAGQALVADIAGEEKELLDQFLDHIRRSTPQLSRFGVGL